MSCLFMNIPDFEYKKCVYWIDGGCQDNDPNCGNGDALCNETIERVKQLKAKKQKLREVVIDVAIDLDVIISTQKIVPRKIELSDLEKSFKKLQKALEGK